MLFALSFAVAALAPPVTTPPVTPPSLAAQAVARGDFDGARALPASTLEEALYLEASVALAEHRLAAAEELLPWMPPGVASAEIAWRVAHARRDGPAIAARAAALCVAGDRTGRACADAELYQREEAARARVELRERTELGLSPTAPLPALAVSVTGGAKPRRVGAILDTGASQTVLSTSAAAALGLLPTQRSFPIAVAAGGARAEARLALLPRLELGGVVVEALPVLVMDLSELEPRGISLIVSPQQAFDGLRVVLDFERKLLGLEHPDDSGAGAGQVPYYGIGFDLAVRAAVDGGPPAFFGVDTGMDGALALSRRYPTARASAQASAQRHSDDALVRVEGAGAGALAVPVAPVAVRLGDQTLMPEAPCLVSDMPPVRPIELHGFLGNGLWRRGRLVVDTRARRLAIHPPSLLGAGPG